jgi:Ca2+-binding EF-hand superfamily protein
LDDAMLRQGLSPAVAFRGADLNHNNVVTVDELRESIKKFLPDNVLSLADLKKIMMAFDLNRNGMIEEEEFITLFERARNANVTIIESPMK